VASLDPEEHDGAEQQNDDNSGSDRGSAGLGLDLLRVAGGDLGGVGVLQGGADSVGGEVAADAVGAAGCGVGLGDGDDGRLVLRGGRVGGGGGTSEEGDGGGGRDGETAKDGVHLLITPGVG
jgi:hypothetical protein